MSSSGKTGAFGDALLLETGLLERSNGGLAPGPVARGIWSRIEEAVESCFSDAPEAPALPELTPAVLEVTPEPTEVVPMAAASPVDAAAQQLDGVRSLAARWLALPIEAAADGESWSVHVPTPGGDDWELARAEVDGDQLAVGLSADLLGGLLATHADEHGLVIPPRLAPLQAVVLTPPAASSDVMNFAEKITQRIAAADVSVELDRSADALAVKHARWRRRGVPLRVEIGPDEASQREMIAYFRDQEGTLRFGVMGMRARVEDYLDMIQQRLSLRAEERGAA